MTKSTSKNQEVIEIESLADRLARLKEEYGFPRLQPSGELFGASGQIKEELIRRRNQEARELLRQWMAEPDDLGDEWWDEFEQELRANRVTFREVDMD
jgi:hypothetical protein